MRDVVIASAVRTALGRLGGSLKDVQPEELGRLVIEAAPARAGGDPVEVDEVVLGQTKQSADAADLARVAALKAGCPVEVPAYAVMRQCGSGLQAAAGVDPRLMGIGPVPATRTALQRAGLGLDDVGLVEINEVFAAQTLPVVAEVGLDEDILNVNGGAIALGHPLGCSGARILTTLLHDMLRRGTRYGLAGICIAGGQRMATIVEAAG
jgi:acetyl-CoA acetyltransferase